MEPKVIWFKVMIEGFNRAEEGLLGPCRADVRLRFVEGQEEPWDVAAKVDIPGQHPWTRTKTYQRIHAAMARFDEYKRLAERHMVRNCPTH